MFSFLNVHIKCGWIFPMYPCHKLWEIAFKLWEIDEAEVILVSCIALILFLSHRMQAHFRTQWPKDLIGNRKAFIESYINRIKETEKKAYQTASSRSDYFHSITRRVTLSQRKLFEYIRTLERKQISFQIPVWLNFPNVPSPLPLGE